MDNRTAVCCTMALALAVSLGATAEEAKKPEAKTTQAAMPEGMPPLPKPGPEQDLLKRDVGVWDATVEMMMGPPGTAPAASKGVETNTLLGGLWLVTDFKGDMMGMPFQGHGTTGWDPDKKKYVGTWVDTMSTSVSTSEGTYDPAAKSMTSWMEAKDPTGATTKMKTVSEWKDKDTRVFTMYAPPPGGGADMQTMRITYKRRP